MGVLTRKEYQWLDGRVVPFVQERPKGLGPWPGYGRRRRSSVAAVEETRGGIIRILRGGAYTEERMSDAMALHFGIENIEKISARLSVPASVIEELAKRTRQATVKVTRQFPKLADEDRTTGALFSDLDSIIEKEGWRLRLTHQVFSTKTKEPQTGADGGVIVDIMDREGHRVMKASWIQAKRTEQMPNRLEDLQDVAVQVRQMQSRTKEAYVLLYTPEGIRVFRGTDLKQELTFDQLLIEMLRCPAGDRNRDLIIDTLDKRFLLRAVVTQLS
jgi:hypothetical protein